MKDKKRDFSSSPRRESTRGKRRSKVTEFELDQIKEHFDENIVDIQNQFEIIDALDKEKDKDKIDCILRSQVVFLGSTLDFYFHEITQFGLMKIYKKEWDKTDNYKKIRINIEVVLKALEEGEDSDWFIEFINLDYRKVTMMSWNSIKNQIELIGLDIDKIAEVTFPEIESEDERIDNLEKKIMDLYKRRNFIAHQFDRKHNNAKRQDISKSEVINFISDVRKIVYAVYQVAIDK